MYVKRFNTGKRCSTEAIKSTSINGIKPTLKNLTESMSTEDTEETSDDGESAFTEATKVTFDDSEDDDEKKDGPPTRMRTRLLTRQIQVPPDTPDRNQIANDAEVDEEPPARLTTRQVSQSYSTLPVTPHRNRIVVLRLRDPGSKATAASILAGEPSPGHNYKRRRVSANSSMESESTLVTSEPAAEEEYSEEGISDYFRGFVNHYKTQTEIERERAKQAEARAENVQLELGSSKVNLEKFNLQTEEQKAELAIFRSALRKVIAERNSLQADLDTSNNSLEVANAKYDSLQAELDSSNNSRESAISDCQSLRAQLEKSNSSLKSAIDDCHSVQAQLTTSSQDLASANAKCQSLKDDIATLERAASASKAEEERNVGNLKAHMKDQIVHLEGVISELRADVREKAMDFRVQLQTRDSEVMRLEEEYNAMTEEMKMVEDLKAESKAKASRIAQLEKESSNLKLTTSSNASIFNLERQRRLSQIEQLEKDVRLFKADGEEKAETLEARESHIGRLEEELPALRSKISSQSLKIQDLDKRILDSKAAEEKRRADLQDQVRTKAIYVARLESEIEAHNSQIRNCENQINNKAEVIGKMKKDYTSKVKELESELGKRFDKITELQAKSTAKKDRKEQLTKVLTMLNDHL